jgi:outer membrane cobalamin receptor
MAITGKKALITGALFLLFLCSAGKGGDAGRIALRGRVVDSQSGEGIPYMDVSVPDAGITSISDERGFFCIDGLPPGRWRLRVQRIGYRDAEKMIEIPKIPSPVNVHREERGDRDELLFPVDSVPLWMDELVITASGYSELWTGVSPSIQSISKGDIALRNVRSPGEALRGTAGIHVKEYGGPNSLQLLSVRGASSEQVLILLNGRRMTTPQNNLVDLNLLPVEPIQRIEVLRGGASALYGSDAMGGVINIITSSEVPEGRTGGTAGISTGSWGTQESRMSFRAGTQTMDLTVGCVHERGNGDFRYRTSNGDERRRPNNDHRATDLYLNGNLAFTPGNKLEYGALFHESDTGSPGMESQPNLSARQRDRMLNLDISLELPLHPVITARTHLFLGLKKQRYTNLDGFPYADTRHRDLMEGAQCQCRISVDRHTRVTAKGGIEVSRLGSFNYDPDNIVIAERSIGRVRRRVVNLAVQGEHTRMVGAGFDCKFTATGRYDHPSDFDQILTPMAGFSLSHHGSKRTVTLYGNLSRAYRAPTFNELYWPEDAFAVGNPALVPENGVTGDVGIKTRTVVSIPLEGEICFYRNDVQNLILWKPGSANGKWLPSNLSRARIWGFESALRMHFPSISLSLQPSYSYSVPLNLDESEEVHGRDLIYRPRHLLSSRVEWAIGPLSVLLDYSWTAKRYVTEANTRSLDSYHLVTSVLSVSRRLGNITVEGSITGRNLLDSAYESIRYYPMPLREFEFSLDVRTGGSITPN